MTIEESIGSEYFDKTFQRTANEDFVSFPKLAGASQK